MCLSCVVVILSLSAYWQHTYFCKAETYTRNNASRQTGCTSSYEKDNSNNNNKKESTHKSFNLQPLGGITKQ